VTLYPQVVRDYDESALPSDATESATFALGCFWGPDATFGALSGVVRTRVGYAGGSNPDPTYHALGDHAEAVQVAYDPDELDYGDLVAAAFEQHDPRSQARKRQYQNVVFYESAAERAAVETHIAESDWPDGAVETRIERLDGFHVAEPYHQTFHLSSTPSLLRPFEEAGYDDAAIRESPAAAKVNAHAAGKNVPEFEGVLTYDPRRE